MNSPIPSGIFNTPIPSGASIFSPSPAIPSDYASPSPAIPSDYATPSAAVSNGASPSSAAAASPSKFPSPSRSPSARLSFTTNATMQAFPDETCQTAVSWFFTSQIAYFGVDLAVSPASSVSASTLRSVCFQQGNGSCYTTQFTTYGAANGRDPVFSVDLLNTNLVVGEPYNVWATVALLLSNGTTVEVKASTEINTDDGSNIQSPSSSARDITPAGWNAALLLLLLGFVNLF